MDLVFADFYPTPAPPEGGDGWRGWFIVIPIVYRYKVGVS
jgi:hypothetical protein